MLLGLTIRDIVLIDRLGLVFRPGLCVLTGETGAGKSILLDALGLALFAVSGAQKALAYHLHPVMAALLGMLTGIGGGMTRDVLLAEIPTVLRADLYAVAALAGAAVVVIGAALGLPATAVTIAGAALCFALRFIAIRRGWHLPIAHRPGQSTMEAGAPDGRGDDDAGGR